MISKQQLLKLIKYATKAPSGHNTQPWRFKIEENVVFILPDFSRSLNQADADHHALYISLGCALENLVISANQLDYQANASYQDIEDNLAIKVELFKGAPSPNEWFGCIAKRQVSRGKFKVQELPLETIRKINSVCSTPDVHAVFFNGSAEKSKLLPYIKQGIKKQYSNKAFKTELADWMRFTENSALKTGDGLWAASLGLPSMGKAIGHFVIKHMASVNSETKRIASLVQNSGALVMFIAKTNTPENWISLGRVFQRFGLLTTEMGLKHAHLNMPCEEKEIRQHMAQELEIKGHPLLLLRLGYGETMPYSYRRNVNEILI